MLMQEVILTHNFFGWIFWIRESLYKKMLITSGLGVTRNFDHSSWDVSFIPPRIPTMHQQNDMTFLWGTWILDLCKLAAVSGKGGISTSFSTEP